MERSMATRILLHYHLDMYVKYLGFSCGRFALNAVYSVADNPFKGICWVNPLKQQNVT